VEFAANLRRKFEAWMGLNCNNDARGRAIRLISGIAKLTAGVILLILWAWPAGGWIGWVVSAALILIGGFMIFEGRAGWCVVRAMGFKTRF
jgi:hypothetical protein